MTAVNRQEEEGFKHKISKKEQETNKTKRDPFIVNKHGLLLLFTLKTKTK